MLATTAAPVSAGMGCWAYVLLPFGPNKSQTARTTPRAFLVVALCDESVDIYLSLRVVAVFVMSSSHSACDPSSDQCYPCFDYFDQLPNLSKVRRAS